MAICGAAAHGRGNDTIEGNRAAQQTRELNMNGMSLTKVFLLAGQSNMAGRAYADALPPELALPYPAIRFFFDVDFGADRATTPPSRSAGWTALQPQPKRPSCPDRHFGPELSFGRAMHTALPGDRIGIIKTAYGGTSLDSNWNPDATDGLMLYGHMLNVVTEAKNAATIQLAGFAWLQGESDVSRPAAAAAYVDNFRRFTARLRTDLNAPQLPVVILEFAHRVNAGHELQQNEDRLIDELTQLAAKDGHMTLVRTADLPMTDNIHWNAEGQFEAGRRLATAMSQLVTT